MYTFHEDPGHGWLQVPRAELERLGILDKITAYSYVSDDKQTLYLEEDCDLSTFVEAWSAAGVDRDTLWGQTQTVRHRDRAPFKSHMGRFMGEWARKDKEWGQWPGFRENGGGA